MYTNNRDAYRQAFFTAWEKHLKKRPLNLVETQIIAVIIEHPEFHSLLNTSLQMQEFSIEENPFVHMSLHLAVREQVSVDRPLGTRGIYQALLSKYQNQHDVEHQIMQILASILWESQQKGIMANEDVYLSQLRKL